MNKIGQVLLLTAATGVTADFQENLQGTMDFYYEKKLNETSTGRSQALRSGGPGFPKLEYGCYCRHISKRGIFKQDEAPTNRATGATNGLDPIDALCKQVINGWACLASAGCDLEAQTFQQPSFFGFRYDKDQIITACDHANSGFAADLCKVQTFFALEFMNEYFVSPPDLSYLEDGSQDLNAICNPRVGTGGNNKGKYIRCCNNAEYPDKKVVAVLGSKGCN